MTATNIDRLVGIFADTCDAIRDKTGSSDGIVATDIPDAIGEISTAGFEYEGLSGLKFYYLNDPVIDLRGLNTASFTSMYSMFNHCPYITSLDVSGFDTSSVTNMNYMFYSCTRLTYLDLSSFDISNVTSMSYMFQNSSSLTSLNLQSFTTQQSPNMMAFTRSCSAMTDIIWAINSTTVEPLGHANAFDKVNGTVPTDLNVYVRTSLVNSYRTGTNWTRYANNIKPISQLPQSLQVLYNIDPNDYQ